MQAAGVFAHAGNFKLFANRGENLLWRLMPGESETLRSEASPAEVNRQKPKASEPHLMHAKVYHNLRPCECDCREPGSLIWRRRIRGGGQQSAQRDLIRRSRTGLEWHNDVTNVRAGRAEDTVVRRVVLAGHQSAEGRLQG